MFPVMQGHFASYGVKNMTISPTTKPHFHVTCTYRVITSLPNSLRSCIFSYFISSGIQVAELRAKGNFYDYRYNKVSTGNEAEEESCASGGQERKVSYAT